MLQITCTKSIQTVLKHFCSAKYRAPLCMQLRSSQGQEGQLLRLPRQRFLQLALHPAVDHKKHEQHAHDERWRSIWSGNLPGTCLLHFLRLLAWHPGLGQQPLWAASHLHRPARGGTSEPHIASHTFCTFFADRDGSTSHRLHQACLRHPLASLSSSIQPCRPMRLVPSRTAAV